MLILMRFPLGHSINYLVSSRLEYINPSDYLMFPHLFPSGDDDSEIGYLNV
jgi:hypothetical protein